jgi:hypothetical protein
MTHTEDLFNDILQAVEDKDNDKAKELFCQLNGYEIIQFFEHVATTYHYEILDQK